MLEECERLKRQLSITACSRPGWDLEALEAAGMTSVQIELGSAEKSTGKRMNFTIPTPLFLIRASKVRNQQKK